MKFAPGVRLPHDVIEHPPDEPFEVQRNQPVYRVTKVVAESPWGGLYCGKKIFRNFEFQTRRLTEAQEEECLDVLIKTLAYPTLEERDYVALRRDHAWFEAKKVLGCRKTNLIPEPLDFLEVRNDQDAFSFPRLGKLPAKEPVVICEMIHGENLGQWRKSPSATLARSFRILGEILELIETLHSEKMLLNAAHPGAFYVDAIGRVHFVGTEAVFDASKATQWRRLYPGERYARGFSAPELLLSDAPPTTESDLFVWGAFAWFLLTGESPAKMAADQQQKWARFDDDRRMRMRELLARIPQDHLFDIQGWLHVDGSRFCRTWPDSFINGLFSCLSENREERPPSTAALRSWWAKSPPQPVPIAVGVARSDRVKLTFLAEGRRTDVDFSVRRKFGAHPRTNEDGAEIWSGRASDIVDDLPPASIGSPRVHNHSGRWEYGVVSVDTSEGVVAYSRARAVEMLDGTKPNFCRLFAEQIALSPDAHGPPPRLQLLARLTGWSALGAELFGSTVPMVRTWSIQLLRQRLEQSPSDARCRELLFDQGLLDPLFQNRNRAAAALITTAAPCDVALLVRIAIVLGGAGLDNRIRAARGLKAVGASESLIDEAIRSFELDRPITCVVCHQAHRARDYDQHLVTAHDYVPVDGDLLPLGEALKRHWENVFRQHDRAALTEIVSQLSRRHGNLPIEALELSFCAHFLRFFSESEGRIRGFLDGLGACLSDDAATRQMCRRLLASDNARLREVGRACFLPNVAQRLASEDLDHRAFLRSIGFLVPHSELDERLQMCRALARLGANPIIARECEQQIELDRIVACPECHASLARRELGPHRRLEHEIFELEGERHSWETLVSKLLERVVSPDSDLFAAQTLVEVFSERVAADAVSQLAKSLCTRARAINISARTAAIVGAAGRLAALPIARPLYERLLGAKSTIPLELGLSLFSHAKQPPELHVIQTVAVLLAQPQLSHEIRFSAAATFVRFGADWPEICQKALRGYARSVCANPSERIDALQLLKQRTGESSIVEQVCAAIAESMRIRCPKCDGTFNHREMKEHALREHVRIFDGRSLRRPWSVALECLETYAANPDLLLLDRGEQMAAAEYAADGRMRFIREALKRGIEPGHYRRTLADAAREFSDSVCPLCFAFVPAHPSLMSLKLESDHRLISPLIEIRRVGNSKLWAGFAIAAEDGSWTGPQAGWHPTRIGAALLVLTFATVLTFVFGLLALGEFRNAGTLAAGTAAFGVVASIATAIAYRSKMGNLVDVAWSVVVPHLLRANLTARPVSFLGALCDVSAGKGDLSLRRQRLDEFASRMQSAVSAGKLHEGCLIAALRLRLADLRLLNQPSDIIQSVIQILQRVLDAEVPLSVLNGATDNGNFFRSLPGELLVTVRWRFFIIAFQRRWSVADVLLLAKRSLAIQSLIEAGDQTTHDMLARAWVVLELGEEPFARCGAEPVHFLKKDKLNLLRTYPDLLGRSRNRRILFCSRGLIIDNELHTAPPSVRVQRRTRFVQTGWTYQRLDGGPDLRYKHNPPVGFEQVVGYDISVGSHTQNVHSDPAEFVEQIGASSSLFFDQLAPRIAAVVTSKATGKAARLPAAGLTPCPGCREPLMSRPGEFAILEPDREVALAVH